MSEGCLWWKSSWSCSGFRFQDLVPSGFSGSGGIREKLVVEEFLELFTQGAEEGEEGSGEESEDEEAISLGGAEEELRRSRGGAEEEPWRSRGGAEEELRRN